MGIRAAIVAATGMGVLVAQAQDYPTPSFDCANTTTAQELRICRSPQLSELDGRHGSLVERAIRASTDREKTRADMDAWIERARNPCQTDECLVDAYTSHIRELERIVPAAAPQPAITAPVSRVPQPSVSKPASEPVTSPSPRSDLDAVSDDDDDEADEGGWSDYAIVLVIAALAAAAGLAFRAGRRREVTASAGRDASGGRP
jgi:uncharacterized protein